MEFDQKRSMWSYMPVRSVSSPDLVLLQDAYPVLNLAVADGIMQAVSGPGRGANGLIADVEVQVLGSALCTQVAAGTSPSGEERGLVGNGRTTRTRSSRTPTSSGLGRNGGREDERRGIVSGESWQGDEHMSAGVCFFGRDVETGEMVPSLEKPVPL